jgi:hypothetical protein
MLARRCLEADADLLWCNATETEVLGAVVLAINCLLYMVRKHSPVTHTRVHTAAGIASCPHVKSDPTNVLVVRL